MDVLQDTAFDPSTMAQCLQVMTHSRQHHLTSQERVQVDRDRKRSIRNLLRAREPAGRVAWYRYLLMQSATLGRRLPSLAEFPAPAET